MPKVKSIYPHLGDEGIPGFDWDKYADGWNGTSLKANRRVKFNQKKHTDDGVVVYSHEKYAQDAIKDYFKTPAPSTKEVKSGDVLHITDLHPLDDNRVMATIAGGANNILIELDKETKFLANLQVGDTNMSKKDFVTYLKHPQVKKQLLSMNLNVKVGKDTEKASIWDGFVENLNREMMSQISSNTNAYIANVVGANNGGLIVEISNAVRAFLPGSLLAINRLDVEDFSKFIGMSMEVMVESYRPGWGFIVSRKKYIQHIIPGELTKLASALSKDPDKVFHGKVTGATKYGVFVQISEFIIGMLHKTLVSDTIRDKMRNNEIEVGTDIDVYVHRIEDNRVIFSDVCLAERDDIIIRRAAEEEAEKEAELKSSNEQVVEPELETAE